MPMILATFFVTAGILLLGADGWEYVGGCWIAAGVIWLFIGVRD